MPFNAVAVQGVWRGEVWAGTASALAEMRLNESETADIKFVGRIAVLLFAPGISPQGELRRTRPFDRLKVDRLYPLHPEGVSP
jgi:hypothetical protein